MSEYALLIDNEFKEYRYYDEKPVNIPHKKVTWHDVIREQGEIAFTGLESGNWVIRTALPTLSELRTAKLQQLANKRWSVETGGMTFNGMPLATDVVSQTKYIGAVVGAQLDPTVILNWKLSDGSFVTLDATAITTVAVAVRAHIQACFDREAELQTLIDAAVDQTELDSIDINMGWPN
jgi:hypothetical protein